MANRKEPKIVLVEGGKAKSIEPAQESLYVPLSQSLEESREIFQLMERMESSDGWPMFVKYPVHAKVFKNLDTIKLLGDAYWFIVSKANMVFSARFSPEKNTAGRRIVRNKLGDIVAIMSDTPGVPNHPKNFKLDPLQHIQRLVRDNSGQILMPIKGVILEFVMMYLDMSFSAFQRELVSFNAEKTQERLTSEQKDLPKNGEKPKPISEETVQTPVDSNEKQDIKLSSPPNETVG